MDAGLGLLLGILFIVVVILIVTWNSKPGKS